MYEILTDGQFVFWAAVTLMVLGPSFAYYWSTVRRAEIDAHLKRDMIARGMSAEEIQRGAQRDASQRRVARRSVPWRHGLFSQGQLARQT